LYKIDEYRIEINIDRIVLDKIGIIKLDDKIIEYIKIIRYIKII
jgi:hypothetical protein